MDSFYLILVINWGCSIHIVSSVTLLNSELIECARCFHLWSWIQPAGLQETMTSASPPSKLLGLVTVTVLQNNNIFWLQKIIILRLFFTDYFNDDNNVDVFGMYCWPGILHTLCVSVHLTITAVRREGMYESYLHVASWRS